jgi:hypothetical protein
MSFSVGRLGRVIDVQDEVIIEWQEITSHPTLAEAFIAGENAFPAAWAQDHLSWDKISPGLWMLTAGGDNTGILITEGKEGS